MSSTPANPSNANPTAGTPAGAVSRAGANGQAVKAKSKSKKPQGPKPGAEFVSRVLTPSTLGMVIPLTAAFVILFWTWIRTQVHYGVTSGDWSHTLFVPAICCGLLWPHRAWLERLRGVVFWPGLIPILLGIWTYFFFVVGVPNHLGQGLSLMLCIFGVALLLQGPRVMRYAFLPLAYFFFAITIPEKIMNHATWPLQAFAAEGGYIGLSMLGIKVEIMGNQLIVIDSTTFKSNPLNVAEACSGMRMLIAFLALGGAVSLVGTRMWWKRVILIAMAPPLALLLNIIRIMVLGIASLYNTSLAAGQAHTFIGTLLLIPGFIIYMLILVAMNKAVSEPPLALPPRKENPRPAGVTA